MIVDTSKFTKAISAKKWLFLAIIPISLLFDFCTYMMYGKGELLSSAVVTEFLAVYDDLQVFPIQNPHPTLLSCIIMQIIAAVLVLFVSQILVKFNKIGNIKTAVKFFNILICKAAVFAAILYSLWYFGVCQINTAGLSADDLLQKQWEILQLFYLIFPLFSAIACIILIVLIFRHKIKLAESHSQL